MSPAPSGFCVFKVKQNNSFPNKCAYVRPFSGFRFKSNEQKLNNNIKKQNYRRFPDTLGRFRYGNLGVILIIFTRFTFESNKNKNLI